MLKPDAVFQSHHTAKVQIRFPPGLRPDPSGGGSLRHFPRPRIRIGVARNRPVSRRVPLPPASRKRAAPSPPEKKIRRAGRRAEIYGRRRIFSLRAVALVKIA